MFFVISGYLITTILLSEHARTSTINLKEFYIRRAYRILPAAGTFMLFATVAYWHTFRWIDLGAMFLYLVNFDGGAPWRIGHLWSLGVEEQFYFLWPSALKIFYKHRVAVLLGSIAMGPVFSAVCYHYKVPGGGDTMFPAVAGNLAIGCLLAIYISDLPKIRAWLAWIMLAAVILIPHYPANTPLRTIFELFVLWPLMNCCMAGLLLHVMQTPYRILNAAPVVWLGKLSYSIYLWQQPFFFAESGQPAYKLFVGLGLACLSYYLVERPFLEFREKRSRGMSPPAVVAGAH